MTDANTISSVAETDRQLLQLMQRRAELVLEHAAAGSDTAEPEALARHIRELLAAHQGPLPNALIERVFRELAGACRELTAPITVAYLGPEGTYSQGATHKHFGHSVTALPQRDIAEIFAAVEAGHTDFGVVPVENSTEGAVNVTLDLLMETRLHICGEVRLPIQHHLLSRATSLSDLKAVHAHPQALGQCRGWLDANLPGIPRISESSNAAAARLAVDDATIAAIAGRAAGEQYQLSSLAERVEDIKNNTTRFLIIGTGELPPSGRDSTSLLISAPHRPGGLRRVLLPFESAGVSMTRIESRPARKALWDYVFFIDVDGHQHDSTLEPVLAELQNEVSLMRVLGSYPSADTLG